MITILFYIMTDCENMAFEILDFSKGKSKHPGGVRDAVAFPPGLENKLLGLSVTLRCCETENFKQLACAPERADHRTGPADPCRGSAEASAAATAAAAAAAADRVPARDAAAQKAVGRRFDAWIHRRRAGVVRGGDALRCAGRAATASTRVRTAAVVEGPRWCTRRPRTRRSCRRRLFSKRLGGPPACADNGLAFGFTDKLIANMFSKARFTSG
jgi:hypothetical protein